MESKAEGKLLTGNTLTSVEQCERHADEMISYYCRSHHVLGCGTCMAIYHGNCLLGYIPDIVDTYDIDVEFKTFIADLEDMSGDLCDIEEQSKENNEIINYVHDNLVQELTKLKEDIIKETETNAKEVEDKLANLKEHDENNMHEININIADLEDMSGDLCDIEEQSKENNEIINYVHDNLVQELTKLKEDTIKETETNAKEVEDKLANLKEHDENNMHEINTRCSEYILDVEDLKSKSERLKADGKVCQLYILMKKARCQLDKHAEMVTNTKEESKLTLSIKDCKLETEVNHSQIHLNMSSQRKDRSSKKSVNRSKINQMLRRLSIMNMLPMTLLLVIAVITIMFVRDLVPEKRNGESVLQFNIKTFPFKYSAFEIFDQEYHLYSKVMTIHCNNIRLAHSKESLIISYTQRIYLNDSDWAFTEFKLHVLKLISETFTENLAYDSCERNASESIKDVLLINDNQVYILITERADTSSIRVLNISYLGITKTSYVLVKGTYNGLSVLSDDLVLLQDSTALILDSNWTYIRTIRFDDIVTRLIYIQPSHDNLALFVIDQTSETVVKFDIGGNASNTYKNARLHSPAGLTLDKDGYVYVIGLESKNIHHHSWSFYK